MLKTVFLIVALALVGCGPRRAPQPGSLACDLNGDLILLDSTAESFCKYSREDSLAIKAGGGRLMGRQGPLGAHYK